jgi:hypothetical protein
MGLFYQESDDFIITYIWYNIAILHLNLPVAVKNTNLRVTVMCKPVVPKKTAKRTLWDVVQTFRGQLEAGDLDPDEDIFADVRDRSPGREFEF